MKPPPPHSSACARAAALSLAAIIMLVPANLLPVVSTRTGGATRTDTILSGVAGLWEDGLYLISAIVFAASVLIPLLKLAGLGWLLLAARRPDRAPAAGHARLYSVLEFIGPWSMLDVFLVAFLAGIVQFGALATIEPQAGLIAFAAAVVLTVLATDAFDPRLLWRREVRS